MLPANVDRFLRGTVRSVWELELLLLLRRQRARLWTADELVRDLRASVLIVGDSLDALQKVGLVSRSANDQYQYWPVTPELDHLVDDGWDVTGKAEDVDDVGGLGEIGQ